MTSDEASGKGPAPRRTRKPSQRGPATKAPPARKKTPPSGTDTGAKDATGGVAPPKRHFAVWPD